MPKKSETSERVQRAADELLALGKRPTQQAVRDIIGSGSITTINHALNFWWANLSKKINRQDQHPALPEPVLTAASKLWDQAMVYSHAALDEQRLQLNQALQEHQTADSQQLSQTQIAMFAVQQQNNELLKTNEGLLEQINSLLQSTHVLETSLIHKTSECDEQVRENKQLALLLKETNIHPVSLQISDELFQAKIDLKVSQVIATDLKSNLARQESRSSELQQQLFDQEKSSIKQVHRLELVISQQDVKFNNIKEELESFQKSGR
ncbi:MAG: hypothetical protein OFPII_03910 [Osedax symbiont Rs1]|nr:MAG: hypothetical protein OFPII_03910 [Osedax symbiont Rs1]